MTEDGKKILEFVKEIRRFSEEIALLLKTADDLMKRSGWVTIKGNTAYASSSQSLDIPKRWYPYDLFRFYKNQHYTEILICISIILDEDLEEPPATPINEPLITANYFQYKKGEKIEVNSTKSNFYWARVYEQKKDRKDDGTPFIPDDWEDDSPIQSSKHFGYSLTSVKNAADVETKIVIPLLDDLPKQS
jgi:hypothetical protein